jgi:hypothetical protein
MTVLKYIFNASFSQGPSESINEELWMNTYDVITIKVDSGKEKKDISILPDKAGIKFFCITSDQYGEKGDTSPTKVLQYVIQSSAATPKDIPIVLDRPHVLIGKSMLDTIGNFSTIDIKNGTDSEANVRILVGRDVENG